MIPYKFYFYDDTDVAFLPKGLKRVTAQIKLIPSLSPTICIFNMPRYFDVLLSALYYL